MKPRLFITITAFSLLLVNHPASTAAEDEGLAALVKLMAQIDDADFQLDLLKGMREGLKGRKQVAMPGDWPAAYARLRVSKSAEVREQAQVMALIFGDPQALAGLRKTMTDTKAPLDDRRKALLVLVEKRAAGLAPALHRLTAEAGLRSAALRGLASYDHPKTPDLILGLYRDLTAAERQDAIHTLSSRRAYAARLLDGMEADRIPASDISAFTARQIESLGDEKLNARLVAVWGAIRQTSADKQKLIAKYKQMLTPDVIKKANLSHGRLVFSRTCMQCHRLYGVGAKIGPDLTGSNRANLHYVLENALDPSATIGKDYRLTTIITDDGRVISGIIRETTDRAVTMQTVNQQIVVSREDIDEMRASPVSMMPDGQLEKLKPGEVRDLIGYLATRDQVPLPDGIKLEDLVKQGGE